MKKKFNNWWFRNIIHPYLMKHGPKCCGHLRDTIVYQMWYAGIKMVHVNKWLEVMHEPTIKCYNVERTAAGETKLRVFYDQPDADKRKEIKGQLIQVI